MENSDHKCNECKFAANNSCNADSLDFKMVEKIETRGYSKNIIECRLFEQDTFIEDTKEKLKDGIEKVVLELDLPIISNIRPIKEISILIDQLMIEAGLDTVIEKVGYLHALQHDYLQDLRDEE